MMNSHTPTCRHGAQGVMDQASKATLENEFGTTNDDECMIKILEGGNIQETEVRGLQCPLRSLMVFTDFGASRTKERLDGTNVITLRSQSFLTASMQSKPPFFGVVCHPERLLLPV